MNVQFAEVTKRQKYKASVRLAEMAIRCRPVWNDANYVYVRRNLWIEAVSLVIAGVVTRQKRKMQ